MQIETNVRRWHVLPRGSEIVCEQDRKLPADGQVDAIDPS